MYLALCSELEIRLFMPLLLEFPLSILVTNLDLKDTCAIQSKTKIIPKSRILASKRNEI